MKTLRYSFGAGHLAGFVVFTLLLGTAVMAQTTTNYAFPVVTVWATQPVATVTNSGMFTLYRAGDTNATLNVWYDLGGTASNGVDYATIPPHLLEMPAGAASNSIVIKPLTNPPPGVIKTIVLQLTNSPLLSPVNYEIGSPSEAVVSIKRTNSPPASGDTESE